MSIDTRDQLIKALGNSSSRLSIDKASIANAVAGQFFSLWRATGQPGQGAIPTAAAICDNTTTGGLSFTQQTSPALSYFGALEGACSVANTSLEIHDRLMHMGGLSGIVITSQTVGLNLFANTGTSNLAARDGDASFSEVQWWLEVYTDMGATASNATITVTYNDATTGALTLVAVGGTLRAGRMIPLNPLIPAAAAGKYIRNINTVILSASTGTAGNFGFTCTRPRASLYCPVSQAVFGKDWAGLGLADIQNSACLFPIVLAAATTTGTVRAIGKLAHG